MSAADPLAVEPITAYPQSDADDVASSDDVDTDLDPKRSKLEEDESEQKKPQNQNLEESRRLFQRLWTDEDEIKILKGFLDFTSSRGTTFASHQYDTGPFYDQIKNELELDFNKNQLTEKLRRLKKKYRNTASRMAKQGNNFSFRSQHEMETFDIAKKIWSASIAKLSNSDDEFSNQINSNNLGLNDLIVSDKKIGPPSRRKRSRKRNLDDFSSSPALPQLPAAPANDDVVKVEAHNMPVEPTTPAVQTPVAQTPIMQPVNKPASVNGVIEETVKSCISPIIKELLSSVGSSNGCFGLGLNLPPLLNLSNLGSLMEDEKWKKQQILEMEVYLKRLELIRDQIKLTLEELKGSNVETKLED